MLDRAANDDALFEEMVTFYHQNRTSGSLPAHLDENDCFALSAILKILDWAFLQIFHIWDFSQTKRMKYFPHHLLKQSKKLISAKHLSNIFTLFIPFPKKFHNTSLVDKS